MAKSEPEFGEEVVFKWGLDEVHATVHEVYGPDSHRQVVVMLTRELSGSIAMEPTTLALPLDQVERVGRRNGRRSRAGTRAR